MDDLSNPIVSAKFIGMWDVTDLHSTSYSNASANSSQQNGKWLQRSIDTKVRKLRALLTADEDITIELDRVVCRLMQLALKTSRNQEVLPSTSWLQCKLLDLLTLTERAIERRRRRLINKNPLAVSAPGDYREIQTFGGFSKIYDEGATKNFVEKYTHYKHKTDTNSDNNGCSKLPHRYVHLEVEDDLSATSNEFFKTYGYNNRESSSSPTSSERHKNINNKSRERNIASTKHYYKPDNYPGVSSSVDTDQSIKNNHINRCKKTNKKCKKQLNNELESVQNKVIKSIKSKGDNTKSNEMHGGKKDKKRLIKKIIKKKSFHGYIFKNNLSFVECKHYNFRIKRKIRQHRQLKKLSNSIPNSLINLCHQNINMNEIVKDLVKAICDKSGDPIFKSQESVAFTDQSCVIEFVTDKISETLSIHQTVATDLNECCSHQSDQLLQIKSEARLDSVSTVAKRANCSLSKLLLSTENEESQAMFLYDINEPSTSKGVRHINMDVQCGPDTGFICPVSSTTTTVIRNPTYITDCDANKGGDEYVEHITIEVNKSLKGGTSLTPKTKPNGIQIKDSDNAIRKKLEDHNISPPTPNLTIVSESVSQMVTKLDDHTSGVTNTLFDDSNKGDLLKIGSEHIMLASRLSDVIIKPHILPKEMETVHEITSSGPIQPKLTRAGIYVHSYKDKIQCEDIIYQGEWQRLTPKKVAKKSPFEIIFIKKNTMQNNNKKRNQVCFIHKNLENSTININYNRRINKDKKLSENLERTAASRKTIKCLNKNIKRATSKIFVSTVLCKKAINEQEPSKTVKITQNTKKDKKNIPLMKSYMLKDQSPCKLTISNKNRLNKNIIENPNPAKDYHYLNDVNALSIKNELLKFIREPCQTISYAVFRNKIEKETDGKRQSSPIKEIRNSKDLKSVRNMQSTNSSSSSTNSIATIRQLSPQSQARRKLPSKMTLKVNNVSKTSSPTRRINNTECTKKTSILFDDKENDPQSSNFGNTQTKKESELDLDRTKSIVISRNSISKHKNKTSNVSIKKTYEATEKKFCTSSSSTSKKVSLADPVPNVVTKILLHSDPNLSNLVLVLESYKTPPHIEAQKHSSNLLVKENNVEIVSVDDNLESLADDDKNFILKDSPDMYHEIMGLLEERLNFIDEHSYDKPLKISQGKQAFHGERNKNHEKVHFDDTFENEAAETSLVTAGSTQVNVDLISFKSFASVSGFSEYFLADNEFSPTSDSHQTTTSSKKSVHEIFERNDQERLPYSGTVQGFSGFSINEQVMGDQPDYVNLIDSETGSVARGLDVRRATSEEVFTSGRSSDTYLSCQVDDDNLVPRWLFQAINQQRSEEENEPQLMMLPMQLPIAEPDLDLNANILEPGVVVGAGAGDGRGIHSDQDSSGRDTSMSSTETSSGQQSEAILVDPSAYATNIEYLREPSSRPFFQLGSSGSPDSSFQTVEGSENDTAYSVNAGSTRNDLNLGMIQSDRDADVSSLDTDIADFSDN